MIKYKLKQDLNYRLKPSLAGSPAGKLKKDAIIFVSERKRVIETVNKEKVDITWGKFTINEKAFWISTKSKYVARDYGHDVARDAIVVANETVKKKKYHGSGTGKINCSKFVTKACQRAGVLDTDKEIWHKTSVNKESSKKTIGDVVGGYKDLKHYSWHKCHCTLAKIPKEHKREGTILVFNNNISVITNPDAKKTVIYNCNLSGKRYTKLSMIRKTSGINWTRNVLAYGVPKVE